MLPRILKVVIASVMGFAVTACSGQANQPGDASSTPPITAHAQLDHDNALIVLPLDSYSMSTRDQQIVSAAQQIVFARCITGASTANQATLQAARKTLAESPSPNQWIFGWWDSDFIAKNGTQGSNSSVTLGDGLGEIDRQKAAGCVASADYVALSPVTQDLVTNDSATQNLVLYSRTAYNQTLADPRFRSLTEARKQCLIAQGYQTDPSNPLGVVLVPVSASAEESLKATLAQAKCSDDQGFTQQAGDIAATYQQQLISQHQAELVTIKKLADDRVTKASALLKQLGVM